MVKIENLKDVPSFTVAEVRNVSNDNFIGLVLVVPRKGGNHTLAIANVLAYDKKQVYYTPVINLDSPNVQDWPEEIYRIALKYKVSSGKDANFAQGGVDSIDKLVDYFRRCPGRIQALPLTPSAKRRLRLRRVPRLNKETLKGNCYAIPAGHHYIPSVYGDLHMATMGNPVTIDNPTHRSVVLSPEKLSHYYFSTNTIRYCEYKNPIFNKSCQLSVPLIVTSMVEIPVNDEPIAPGYLCFGCSRKALNKALGRGAVNENTIPEVHHFYVFINIDGFNKFIGFKIGERKNVKYTIYNDLR